MRLRAGWHHGKHQWPGSHTVRYTAASLLERCSHWLFQGPSAQRPVKELDSSIINDTSRPDFMARVVWLAWPAQCQIVWIPKRGVCLSHTAAPARKFNLTYFLRKIPAQLQQNGRAKTLQPGTLGYNAKGRSQGASWLMLPAKTTQGKLRRYSIKPRELLN